MTHRSEIFPHQGNSKGKLITVIGGAGFIGTHLCQSLNSRQIPFEIIDMKESRNFPNRTKVADIREYVELRDAIEGSMIIHLAAVHTDDVRDRSIYNMVNVEGTRNICRVAAEKEIRKIIFTSSVAVYGFAKPNTSEEGEIDPFNEYGKSKYEGEKVLQDWYESDKLNRALTIVRPTVVFGEGNRGNVYNLIKQVQSGKFLMVGSGNNRKSMAYIGNFVNFLEAVVERDSGFGLYNYVDKPDFDMNGLVAHVRQVLSGDRDSATVFRIPYSVGLLAGYFADLISWCTKKPLPLSSIRIRKFCAVTTFSSSAHTVPGFSPPYSLVEGIDQTIESEFLGVPPRKCN